MPVVATRIRIANDVPTDSRRDAVVYWMIGARRASWSFALDRAVELAIEMDKPLLVLEPLRVDYPWASERFHAFVIEGMRDNAAAFARAGVGYHPYVEGAPGEGKGLLEALARRAAVVVTDEALGFFQPRMIAAAARKLATLGTRLEVVDGNGIFPVWEADKAYPTAYAFRRTLQRLLPAHVDEMPRARPFHRVHRANIEGWTLPAAIARRWPAVDLERPALHELPIDHAVKRSPVVTGGARAARACLADFVEHRLARYQERSHPDDDATSGLSPWLHFGHLSAHEVFAAVAAREEWSPASASGTANGSKEGFWGMSPEAEAFLDELITWRELAHNGAAFLEGFDSFDGLPTWAKATLTRHARDRRPVRYSRAELEGARTHDEMWNAAQRQLVEEGVLHNSLRMLWGKKVLEWSASPVHAFDTLVDFNNKYAVDGRDPNSWAGIAWCFGRYDRPWGPERPIFGLVRFMSSESMRKKLRVKRHLARWGGERAASAQLR